MHFRVAPCTKQSSCMLMLILSLFCSFQESLRSIYFSNASLPFKDSLNSCTSLLLKLHLLVLDYLSRRMGKKKLNVRFIKA